MTLFNRMKQICSIVTRYWATFTIKHYDSTAVIRGKNKDLTIDRYYVFRMCATYSSFHNLAVEKPGPLVSKSIDYFAIL